MHSLFEYGEWRDSSHYVAERLEAFACPLAVSMSQSLKLLHRSPLAKRKQDAEYSQDEKPIYDSSSVAIPSTGKMRSTIFCSAGTVCQERRKDPCQPLSAIEGETTSSLNLRSKLTASNAMFTAEEAAEWLTECEKRSSFSCSQVAAAFSCPKCGLKNMSFKKNRFGASKYVSDN